MCLSGAHADVPLVTDIRQLCCSISGCCNILGIKGIKCTNVGSFAKLFVVCMYMCV